MNKAMMIVAAGILVSGMSTAGEHPEHPGEGTHKPAVTPQTTCPVMRGKINKQQYVDHDGKRIYVCCAGCIDKIKADPARYIGKLEKEGVVLDAATGTTEDKKGHGSHQ